MPEPQQPIERTPGATEVPEQPIAQITGVATGSYGTASNLDDTELYRVEDFAPAVWAGGIPIDDPPPVDVPPPAELPDADIPIKFPGDVPVEAPGDAPLPMDAPGHQPGPIDVAAVVPMQTRRRAAAVASARSRPVAWAGFAAAAVVVMLVGAILGASVNSQGNVGGIVADATLGIEVTPAPTTDEGDGGGGKGNGGGKGKGNGNGNND